MEEGDIASSFVKDLEPALAPKINVSHQSQAFKKVNNNGQAFTVVGQEERHIFFLDEPLPGAQGHVTAAAVDPTDVYPSDAPPRTSIAASDH